MIDMDRAGVIDGVTFGVEEAGAIGSLFSFYMEYFGGGEGIAIFSIFLRMKMDEFVFVDNAIDLVVFSLPDERWRRDGELFRFSGFGWVRRSDGFDGKVFIRGFIPDGQQMELMFRPIIVACIWSCRSFAFIVRYLVRIDCNQWTI